MLFSAGKVFAELVDLLGLSCWVGRVGIAFFFRGDGSGFFSDG